jgi:hypothetical protein
MSAIAWESFSTCGHRTRMDNAPTRSKLVHNWLNLGVQRGKHGSARQDTLRACPYCASSEDFEHLLSCRSPQAMMARYDATVVLKKALGDCVGGNSIFRAVTQWTLHPMELPTLSSCLSGYQLAIDRAIQSQSDIGWLHLFRGLISFSWGTLFSDGPPQERQVARRSITTINHLAVVIRALQDYSLSIWKSRNEALHANTEESAAILHAQLNHEITTVYDLKATFSPILQSYFTVPLEDRLLRDRRQKQRWLRLVRLATSHATSQGSRQQMMSNYFPYATDAAPAPLPHPTTVRTGALIINHPTLQQVPIRQYFTHPSGCLPAQALTQTD